jgi:hypothetical protein
MESPKCPNCGKEISLIGAGELKDEMGIGPNTIQHAREKGTFPQPWLSFANRNIYLRSDAEEFNRVRLEARRSRQLEDLQKTLQSSSPDDIRELIAGLEKALPKTS